MSKVCKFGGTSMSDAKTITRIKNIVLSDEERDFVIVSAPGKRFKEDIKITDMLYSCYREKLANGTCKVLFDVIRTRYAEIVKDLGISLDIEYYLDKTEKEIDESNSPDFAASRGEYLGALIAANYFGYDFIDAKDIVRFRVDGSFDAEYTNDIATKVLKSHKKAVIPGFYGSLPDGSIKTFSRGGSDISGAIIARAVKASVYENWTDVDGFMVTDPRIVENPQNIKKLSYKELRELSYMGANVLHPDSIFPVKAENIPINIRNTFNPDNQGTMILPYVGMDDDKSSVITGIAGRKGFAIILIEKSLMNSEVGFVRKVLTVIENMGINIEHVPSGIDTLSIVLSEHELENGKLDMILNKIRELVSPDTMTVYHSIALIATVGHAMAYKPGTAAKLFTALSNANINIRMIDQGSSEMNIIVGVANEDYENAIRAIYNGFVEKK